MTLTGQAEILIFLVSITLQAVIFIAVKLTSLSKDLAKSRADQKRDVADLREDEARDNAQARQDLKNIGDKVRQSELKLIYVAMMTCYDPEPKRSEEKRQEVLNALVRRLT